jgi:hypothetical protein
MNQNQNSKNTAGAVDQQRLVRPFEVGQSVDYHNHVMGYRIFPLEVASITDATITAKSEEGRTFTFHADTGVATWSGNLSIIHWPNNQPDLL